MNMNASIAQPPFPFGRAALLLTAVAGLILAGAWLTVGLLHPGARILQATVLCGGGVVWIASLLGMTPVALLGRRGVMPTVYGYFLGMGVRLVLVMGAAMALVHSGRLPGRPMALVLAIFYLPLLLAEVSLVGRYLWHKDFLAPAGTTRPGSAAGPAREVVA